MKNKKESPEFIRQLEKCNTLYQELMQALDKIQKEKLGELALKDFMANATKINESIDDDIENRLKSELKLLLENFKA